MACILQHDDTVDAGPAEIAQHGGVIVAARLCQIGGNDFDAGFAQALAGGIEIRGRGDRVMLDHEHQAVIGKVGQGPGDVGLNEGHELCFRIAPCGGDSVADRLTQGIEAQGAGGGEQAALAAEIAVDQRVADRQAISHGAHGDGAHTALAIQRQCCRRVVAAGFHKLLI